MVNTQELENAIKESGYKKEYLAKLLNISSQAFYKKCKNKTLFKMEEVLTLRKALKLDTKRVNLIFFESK